jgi:hypothetical protein
MPDNDPAMRVALAKLAAHEKWAQTGDRAAATAPARAAALARFERQVDPDGALPERERRLRAESARRAYFQRLAIKSARARRARRVARGAS